LEYTSDDAPRLRKIGASFEEFYTQGQDMAEQYILHGPEVGNRAMEAFDAYVEDIGGRVETLVEEMQGEATGAMAPAMAENTTSRNVALSCVLLVIALTVAIALVLSGKISKAIIACVEFATKVADNDLTATVEVSTKDETRELAEALTTMVENIKRGREEIEAAAKAADSVVAEVTRTAGELQAGQLSERADVGDASGQYRSLIEVFNGAVDSIVQPLNDASGILERIAQRDLQVRMEGSYTGDHAKMKETVNTAVGNLDESLSQVTMSASQVDSAAGQISSGSQSLAQGASEQASSLEEVSSSLAEVGSMSQQSAANAQEAKSMTDAAQASTAKGRESMERLSQAIDKIKASSDETAEIVKTIDEIAFQTNLLALNAAVEAARAGEAGQGFAVVAEEVRNLAMRSADAARNTSSLINDSVQNAESGVSLNQEVLANLEEINGQVSKVSEVMSEIATASEQQNQGITQINTGVEQMNQVTQQNAANSEESSSAAEELAAQAGELQSLVGRFQLSSVQQTAPRVAPVAAVVAAGNGKANGNGNGHVNGNGNGNGELSAESLIPFDEEDEAALKQF